MKGETGRERQEGREGQVCGQSPGQEEFGKREEKAPGFSNSPHLHPKLPGPPVTLGSGTNLTERTKLLKVEFQMTGCYRVNVCVPPKCMC